MEKFKLISIIEGIIIVVLVVLLVLSKSSNNQNKIVSDKEVNNRQDKVKDYVGIYHTNNYGYYNRYTYNEVNITLNDDNTCDVSLYKDSLYACNYEETSKDKINLVISTYIGFNDAKKDKTLANSFVTGWKLAPTKEKCESILKDYKDKNPSQYEDYTECVKVEETHNITLLENGLLYEDRQFSKVK